jgi:AraC-like DNA-binding protein
MGKESRPHPDACLSGLSDDSEKLRFNDEYHSSRFFKKCNGCSPMAYREQLRKG